MAKAKPKKVAKKPPAKKKNQTSKKPLQKKRKSSSIKKAPVKKKTLNLLKALKSKKAKASPLKKTQQKKIVLPVKETKKTLKEKPPAQIATKNIFTEAKKKTLELPKEEVVYNPKFEYIPFNPPHIAKSQGKILTAEGFERLYETSHSS